MDKDLNILITFDLSDAERAHIQGLSDRIKLTVIPAKRPEDVPEARWAKTDVLYTRGVLPKPEQAPDLRWVQFNTAGVDPYLDHPLLRGKHVKVTSMSGVITSQIAEYVLMAMLAFGQRLPKLVRDQANRHWPSSKEKRTSLLPLELRDSTVAILGYGSIGRQVARLLKPFGATVLAAKKNVRKPEDSGYHQPESGDPQGEFFDRLYPIEALHSMLKESDFVVLSLPLTDATRHILNVEAFDKMKPTAFVINIGRGALIDEPALVQALQTKKIAGAALDVFEEEPLPEESPLWAMENVIISPHIAGLSRHITEETLSFFMENLQRFLAEQPFYSEVNLDQGY